MRKKVRYLLIALFMSLLMILETAVPAAAAEDGDGLDIASKITVTLYSKKDTYKTYWVYAKNNPTTVDQNMSCLVSGFPGFKATNLKSSKPSVAQLVLQKGEFSNDEGDSYTQYTLYIKAKKTGTAVLSFKYKGKTYKTKVTVKKYKNPVKSIKIGSKTLSAKKFASNSVLNLKYSDFVNKKTKVKVTAAKGWKLKWGVNYMQRGWGKCDGFDNGGSVKVKGGKGFFFVLDFVEKATGREEIVIIYLK